MSQLLTNKLEIYVDLLDKHVKILIKPYPINGAKFNMENIYFYPYVRFSPEIKYFFDKSSILSEKTNFLNQTV